MKAAAESSILAACLQLLHLRGIFAWRNNQGVIPLADGRPRKFAGLRGVADILGVLSPSGRLLAIEVKKPGGRLRPEQRKFLDIVTAMGGVACVVHGVDELMRVLDLEKL